MRQLSTCAWLGVVLTLGGGDAAAQVERWKQQFGTAGTDSIAAIVADHRGVCAAGTTTGALAGSWAGGTDAFIACFGASGSPLWKKQIGTPGPDSARGIAALASGDLIVVGAIGKATGKDTDAWVARYSRDGQELWRRTLSTPVADIATAVSVLVDDIAVAGQTAGALAGTAAGATDVWAATFSADGVQRWIAQTGSKGNDTAEGVTYKSLSSAAYSGLVIVSGSTTAIMPGAARGFGATDVFLARFDGKTGKGVGMTQLGSAGVDVPRGIAGSSFDTYVVGSTTGALDGAGAGSTDLWIIKINSGDQVVWKKQLGSSGSDVAYGIATDESANPVVVATTSGSLGTSAGGTDAWLGRFGAGGAQFWRKQMGTAVTDNGQAVALDPSGRVYVGGSTTGALGGTSAGLADAFLARLDPAPVQLAAIQPMQAVRPGEAATFSIELLRATFDNPMDLSVSGLPAGAAAAFSADPTADTSTVLTVTTSATTPAGKFTLKIGATASGVAAGAAVMLVVQASPAVVLAAATGTQTVDRGVPATFRVNLTRTGYTGPVHLWVAGLGAGTTASWSSTPALGNASVLTVDTAPWATTGSRTLTIGASASGLTIAVATATLTVNGPTGVVLGATSSTRTAVRGQSTSYGIPLTRTGYSGAVTLAAAGLPAGVTATFSANDTTADSTALTLATTSSAPLGGVSFQVTATAADIAIAPLILELKLTEPVILSAPASWAAAPGTTYTGTIDIQRTSFPGSVTFAVAGVPSTMIAAFSPASTSSTSVSLKLTLAPQAPAGTTTLTITGSATGTTIAPIQVNVVVAKPVGVALTWGNMTNSGAGYTDQLFLIERTNFTGTVNLAVNAPITPGVTFSVSPTSTTGTVATAKMTASGIAPRGLVRYELTAVASGLTIAPYPGGAKLTPDDAGRRVAVDCAGASYWAGTTYSSLAGTYAGNGDAWGGRIDPAGTPSYMVQHGTSAGDQALDAAADCAGSIYTVGATSGALAGTAAGSADIWIARRADTGGAPTWAKQLGTSSYDVPAAVAATSAGAYVVGSTTGALEGTSAGSYDAVIAYYDAAGTLVWKRQFGTSGADQATGAAVDAAGNLYVAGTTDGALVGPTLGGKDGWLAKYDSAGNRLWGVQIGTALDDAASAVAASAAGGVWVVGSTLGELDGVSAWGTDGWVASYDAAGIRQWTRQFGSKNDDAATSVATDGAGNLYVVGVATTYANFHHGWLYAYGGTGRLLWTIRLPYQADGLGAGAGKLTLIGRRLSEYTPRLSHYDAATGSFLWETVPAP